MAFIVDNKGQQQVVPIDGTLYQAAHDANVSVPQYLNQMYAKDVDTSHGTPFQQLLASEGLLMSDDNVYGLRAPRIADLFSGKWQGASNVTDRQGGTYGGASRTLFPVAVIAAVESLMAKDRETDLAIWRQMVGNRISVAGSLFEQPVIDYQTLGGPEGTRAQRIAELAEPPSLLKFTTTDRPRRIPTWAIGAEFSDQSLKASTLDIVAMTFKRYLEVEYDAQVYEMLSSIFSGDGDNTVGAIPAVTSASLDSASTGGVLTHKAWIKFLARNRRFRRIDYAIGDIDTYLKVEGRTGRPGSNNYDPSLERLDPQARVINEPFGSEVKWFIVDSAADGGPVPANTIWTLDSRFAITEVTNTEAAYKASEEFVMRRSQTMRLDWGTMAYRTFGDSELKAFDVLTIS